MIEAIKQFLLAAARLANKGVSKRGIENFAKQEFGEISEFLQAQINNIFRKKERGLLKVEPRKPIKKEGEVIEAVFKPGKDKKGKVVEESPSQASGIMASEEASPLMKRLEEGAETLKGMKKPGMDLSVGLTRTAVRKILAKEGVDVPDKVDPIDLFTKKYGADILMDVKNVAEEMIELERMGKSVKSMDEILEQEGMFNLPKRKNPPQGYTDEEMQEINKAIEQENILLDFDTKGRKPSAEGGLNRVGLKSGSYLHKAYKGSALEKLMTNPRVEGTALGYEGLVSLMDILRGFGLFSKGGRVGLKSGSGRFGMGITGLQAALKNIMNKFGKDAITTADKIDRPESSLLKEQFDRFNKDYPPAPSITKKGKFTAAEVLLQRLKNTLNTMKDSYVQKNFPNFIKEIEANPKLAEDPKVQEAFGLRDLPKNQRLVEYDDGTFDFYTQGSKKGMGSVKALADEFDISMEEAMKIKMMEPEDQILEIERRRALKNRNLNAEGGLNYLMGM